MTATTTPVCAREENFVEITTLKGDVILLDAVDAGRLPSGYLHIANGYARIDHRDRGVRSQLSIHRFVLGLVKGDGKIADHINGNPLDNRRANLRIVTRSMNALNRHVPYASNTSGFLGVYFDKRGYARPFRASIWIERKHMALGTFETPEAAYAAYLRAKEPVFSKNGESPC